MASSEAQVSVRAEGARASRGPWNLLLLVALGAGVLRAYPLLRQGAFGYPVDYDEGVYFTASALLFQGLLPYRDFLFVHPPGALWGWGAGAAWTAWVDPATLFTLTRWMAVCVGAVNAFLAGRLAWRHWGPVAGGVAALVYASYPEVVGVERGPFLEPLLNLACLGLANLWLTPSPDRASRRWRGAGLLGGLALSVKALGGIWLAAALLSAPSQARWRAWLGFTLAAGVAVGVLIGPFLVASPAGFFQDVLLFQSQRPADGDLSRLIRLREIFHERRLVGVGLTLLGLQLATVRSFQAEQPSRPAERFFAFTYATTVAAFLASPGYWNQYNAHLAASESLLAGLGASALQEWLRSRHPSRARAVLVLLGLAIPLCSFKTLRAGSRQRAPEQVAIGRTIRDAVPREASLCAFEPTWGLAAGRLPPRLPGAPLVVDSYALMLRDAIQSGERFASTDAALQAPTSQRDIRVLLERCRFVVLGQRGVWQLSEDSESWFRSRFVRRAPLPGRSGLDLWERTSSQE